MNPNLPLKTNYLNTGKEPSALVSYKNQDGSLNVESLAAIGKAMNAYEGVTHQAHSSRTLSRSHGSRDLYAGVETNISVRNEFNRGDYEYFRPGEALPKRQKDIIGYCMEAYRRVGILKNVIDLMSDFGTQGITLVHSNPRIQKLYQDWFYSVNGPERSERFLNYLYRSGNIVCRRIMGKLPEKTAKMLLAIAKEDNKLHKDVDISPSLTPDKMVIPWRYTFINPYIVDVIGGELSQFVGRKIYVLKISPTLKQAVSYPKDEFARSLIKELPADLLRQFKSDKMYVELPQDKLQVFHYKKDDWQDWADPMIYSILDDVILLEKMKLADLAALDGAISQVRVWKLGDIAAGLFPTDTAITKLMEILLANPGGGAYDIIWGPDLTVDTVGTDVHQFLGKTKYEPCLEQIYSGLGVPPTLTGSQNAAGTTNNYISLKTLVQRLEYGRRLLEQFWNKEIVLFRQAMSIRLPASIRFDRMVLSDEAAEKSLLIQMWDRNLVSDSTILERFGEDAWLEVLRTRREERERKSETRLRKASPYHMEDKDHDMRKAALSRLLLSPKQAGVDVEEMFKKNPFLDSLDKQSKTSAAKPGASTKDSPDGKQGRPKNSGDTSKRTKTDKPKLGSNFAMLMLWAKEAQDQIHEIVMPGLLSIYGKENARQMSAKEFNESEHIKFSVLASFEPFAEITAETVYKVMKGGLQLPTDFNQLYNLFYNNVVATQHREPTIKDKRVIQSTVFSILKGNNDE